MENFLYAKKQKVFQNVKLSSEKIWSFIFLSFPKNQMGKLFLFPKHWRIFANRKQGKTFTNKIPGAKPNLLRRI